MKSSSRSSRRSGMTSSNTMAKPDSKAPKMKNGGNSVECQPTVAAPAKSSPTMLCTEHDQRRHDRRQDAIGRVIVPPLAVRAAEAQCQHAVEDLLAARRRVIAHRREIREQAEIPEQDRGDDIGQDREEIPQQRAAELRPQRAWCWDRETANRTTMAGRDAGSDRSPAQAAREQRHRSRRCG